MIIKHVIDKAGIFLSTRYTSPNSLVSKKLWSDGWKNMKSSRSGNQNVNCLIETSDSIDKITLLAHDSTMHLREYLGSPAPLILVAHL